MELTPKFVADGMLGSLARKLRLYGLDVLYYPDMADDDLLRTCEGGGRVLLTSDRELHGRAVRKGVTCVEVSVRGDAAMAALIFKELAIRPPLEPSAARCPVCNGEVIAVDKGEVSKLVPPQVLARQERFYQCASCQHVYWEGGHWFRLARFDQEVKEALKG
jgi:uncharacterized protein with PIN domain